MAYDLVIRGGFIVDGSGLPGYQADLGVIGDKIASIGDLKGQAAKEVIEADGHVVAPGFIDGHTHMDAQVFWDPLGTCSCWHGVTSVVMGNCGFSLAPCAEKDKALVLRNFERAEDISRAAMEAGIPWSWETFPEFLDTLEKLPKGINYSSHVGHSALRTYVMGERALSDKADDDDLRKMKAELESSIRAGAMGFSTSRLYLHRTPEGRPVASRVADWDEVKQLVGVLGKLGAGVFEISRENTEKDPEYKRQEQASIKQLAVDSGVPMTFGSAWYHRRTPTTWRSQYAMVDEAVAEGANILVQGGVTCNGSLRSFETILPFDKAAVWSEFRKLPLTEQEAGLRDPAMRQRLVDSAKGYKRESDPAYHNALLAEVDWNWVFPLYNPLPPYTSVAEIAQKRGQDPIDTMIDLALEKNLKLFFLAPQTNESLDFVLANIRHPRTALTFSDSGAHVTSIINPIHTLLLAYWVREKQAMTMEAAIRKVSYELAAFWSLDRRGMLREGYFADVVVFDPQSIGPALPTLVRDLPTGAERLLQKATGIRNTVVNGRILMAEGEHVGALPGRLLRGKLAHH